MSFKPNKFTIWNAKGGVGKTPIAFNIFADYACAIGTNETFHCYESLPSVPSSSFVSVPLEQSFPKYADDVDIVFDLAGSISQTALSITSAIEYSDLVIVPIKNEWKAINSGVNSIHQILKLGKPVLVVATQLEKARKEVFLDWSESESFKNIRDIVHKTNSSDIQVLPLKMSTAFDTIFDREMSVGQICKQDKLLAHSYRVVDEQFEDIYRAMGLLESPILDTHSLHTLSGIDTNVHNEVTRAH